MENSGVLGAASHPSSSQWLAVAETVQGGVTDEGSWGSGMLWCAAHPSCMGSILMCAANPTCMKFDNLHSTFILRGILDRKSVV